jgi:ribosome-associated toxin RatA of RatAB toxin-antitoxin module
MASVKVSREIAAPLDKVWAIVSDVDNEPQYWHGTKSVRNISKEGNVIKREAVIAFKDSKTMQTVTLNPKTSVETKITEGPILGTKLVTLSSAGDKTRVDVAWDFKLAGFLGMFSGMVKKHINEGSEQALERIAKAVE